MENGKSKKNNRPYQTPKRNKQSYAQYVWIRNMFLRLDAQDARLDNIEEFLKSLGYDTTFIPNGVNIEKFIPVTDKTRLALREKYGARKNSFIILHVASVKRKRNLEIMKTLARIGRNLQVIIVGRIGEKRDEGLACELEEAGCLVLTQYFPNIEEIYALSDCYLFPTVDRRACIETPLSVLEAMSCNIPVITTRIGALPRMFDQGNGLFYIEDNNDIGTAIDKIRNGEIVTKTRDMVLPYSWENIAREVTQIYEELLREKRR
jgi:glycosyltransferase involved in cell wall biosynthesis